MEVLQIAAGLMTSGVKAASRNGKNLVLEIQAPLASAAAIALDRPVAKRPPVAEGLVKRSRSVAPGTASPRFRESPVLGHRLGNIFGRD